MKSIVYLGVAIVAGCDVNAYVPTEEHLLGERNSARAFIVAHRSIEGVYGNMDVDSEIFTYVTDLEGSSFWKDLNLSATSAGWVLTEDKLSEQAYLRVVPRTGEQAFHSAEEVRVALVEANGTVVVGWIQADVRDLPKQFPSQTPEGRFAKSTVWPKFRKVVAEREKPPG